MRHIVPAMPDHNSCIHGASGTSDYQAAWLLDDDLVDGDDASSEDDNDGEGSDAAMGSGGGDEDPPELEDLLDDEDGTGEETCWTTRMAHVRRVFVQGQSLS